MMDTINNDHVFKSTTNWTLAGGSLTDSISFDDGSISAAVDHVSNSPLLLLPPIHEDKPCEITITFAQEHELRQIYIRSSARVYEVYYTKNRRDDREYLCTVRCGIAIREEEVLQIPLIELASPKNRLKDNGNGRMNEDDWVDVKSADTSFLKNGKDQLGKQDYFEATAEINDAEPCISITLRLLSLQNKRCALIDEVYVFADPIDQSELEKDEEEANGTRNNSSSSALMAMFMPALMQLSRAKNVRQEQVPDSGPSQAQRPIPILGRETNACYMVESNLDGGSYSCNPITTSALVQETNFSEADSVTRVSEEEMKQNNMETMLHQLVNKVSSIETILTRFEDQMLKPINSIDARLRLVEKKVEELCDKKSNESESLFETKVSNTDSLDDPQLESCMDVVVVEVSNIINSEECGIAQSISVESEMSKEEVDHSFERRSDVEEKPKRSVSINDALASALAGLLSSTSIMERKYSKALVVTAPEFPNEEIEEKPHTSSEKELGITRYIEDDSNGVSENLDYVEDVKTVVNLRNDDLDEEPVTSRTEPDCYKPSYPKTELENLIKTMDSNGVSENLDDVDNAETVVSLRNNDLDEKTVTSRTKANCHEPSNPKTELEKLNLTVLKSVLGFEPSNPETELENPIKTMDSNGVSKNFDDVDDDEKVTSITKANSPSNPETELEKPNLNVLKSVLGFEPSNSSIDFSTTVLDVEFKSEKKVSDKNCFFEAFLTTETKIVGDCNEEVFDDRLVSVEDEELIGPPTDTLSSLEIDHYETNEMNLLQFNGEISTSLI